MSLAASLPATMRDPATLAIAGSVLAMLVTAQLAIDGTVARSHSATAVAKARAMAMRMRGWWAVYLVVTGAVLAGERAALVLFAIVSFLALREFVTMAPTARGDHRALFWAFFIILPVQYVLVGSGRHALLMSFIPVACFLFVPLRIAIAGQAERFLERAAMVQWGLMACVFCVSLAPAVLTLDVPGYDRSMLVLLMYFVVVVEISDAFQNLVGTIAGRHVVAPGISPHKTWEGIAGGIAAATVASVLMAPATPFTAPQAAVIGLWLALLGLAGRLVMSAVKRGRGIEWYGVLIEGHGGVLDRVDSLMFAAPVFYLALRAWAG